MSDHDLDGLEGLQGRELGAALLERARRNLPAGSLRPVTVDALGVTVWVKPITLATSDKLTRKATARGRLDEGKYAALVTIHHACSEDGSAMFTEGDLRQLYAGEHATEWVVELAKEIVSGGGLDQAELTAEDDAAEDTAGNSSRLRPVAS